MPRGSGAAERYATIIVDHRRAVLVVMMIATVLVGGGIAFLDGEIRMVQFEVDSDEHDAKAYVESNFESTDHEVTVVVLREGDVLEPASVMETMELQRALRANETVAATLADERSTVGVGNVVAYASNPELTDDRYTIDQKIHEIDVYSRAELVDDLGEALRTDELIPGDRPRAATLLPADYEAGDDHADARLLLVVHDENAEEDELLDAQLAIDHLVDEHVDRTDAYVFGRALTFDRGATATAESFGLIGPLAVVLMLAVLILTYRDPIDVILSVGGIALVLVWTAGFLGWTGIGFSQLLVAVPCLLVGLSIDHGFHVLMRYRESSGPDVPSDGAMNAALAGVVAAIGATTLTTMIGFLAGVASPVAVLREFGLVSAFGILSAFFVFGALLPAVKLEIDGQRKRRRTGSVPSSIGSDRPIARTMRGAAVVSRRAPVAVVAAAVLLALVGGYGLAHVDTSTERTDFLPDGQPAWMDGLPLGFGQDDNSLREEAIYIEETFDYQRDHSISVLLEGDPTDPTTLEAVRAGERAAVEATTLGTRTDGRPIIYSPLDVLETLSREDEQVAAAVDDADTTGDGLPDQDLHAVYDAAFKADPGTMAEVVHRTDEGEYAAVRIVVTVDDHAAESRVRWEMRSVADTAGSVSDGSATATGEPILSMYRERAVVTTVFVTFLSALVVITSLLTAAFRLRHGSWTLGAITIAPVILALAWVVGVMFLRSIPFNAETAIITGIAVGIGVDYAIHVTERFVQELGGRSAGEAIETALVETGGALLASAVTTVVGFGILTFTFVPSLQRFGLLTALFVTSAFVASVIVLPAMLTIWARSATAAGGDTDGHAN